MRVVKWLAELLFPPKCILCGKILRDDEKDLCGGCAIDAPFYPYGVGKSASAGKNTRQFLDSFGAVWYYEGAVRNSIHKFKFQKGVGLAPGFGRMLAERVRESGPLEFDVLTWVPVSRRRRWSRGYDQCELLAKAMGEELGTEAISVLRKIRHNPPQSGLTSPEERKANVLGAYAMRRGRDIAGKRVLILDDVYTTGATMNECARVLLTAGAKEVHCIVLAAVRQRKK